MAQRTVVTLIDDLTGEESDDITTVEFGLDGVTYEVDLDGKNADELRDTLAVYVECGRRTGGRAKRGSGSSGGARSKYSRETLRNMRQWARSQGFEINDRGRVPGEVVEAWEKAHQGAALSAAS